MTVSKKSHGIFAEKHLAKRLAHAHPGSGAIKGLKGDITYTPTENLQFLTECKSTVNDSISLKKLWLEKITKEALDACKYPSLAVQFVTEEGKPLLSWVAVPEYVFIKLVANQNAD